MTLPEHVQWLRDDPLVRDQQQRALLIASVLKTDADGDPAFELLDALGELNFMVVACEDRNLANEASVLQAYLRQRVLGTPCLAPKKGSKIPGYSEGEGK